MNLTFTVGNAKIAYVCTVVVLATWGPLCITFGGPCHHGSLLGNMRFVDVTIFTQPWYDLFAKLAKYCTVYTLEVMT